MKKYRKILPLCVVTSLFASVVYAQVTATTLEPSKILSVAVGLVTPLQKVSDALLIKPGDKISFIGDSITDQGGYLRIVAYVLNTAYPELKLPQFVNGGVSGQKAEDMAPRFEKSMKLADKPAWVFISVGINDVWHRVGKPHDPAVLAAYRDNVVNMVDKAQAAGAKAVLLTPTVIYEDPASEGNKRLAMYVDAMKSIASEKKCEFVDLHSMFLEAIVKKPANIRLTSDNVHMGPYGDSLMAIGVLRVLGVPDAKIASLDLTPILSIRWAATIPKAAEQLQVPVSRILGLPGAVFFF